MIKLVCFLMLCHQLLALSMITVRDDQYWNDMLSREFQDAKLLRRAGLDACVALLYLQALRDTLMCLEYLLCLSII